MFNYLGWLLPDAMTLELSMSVGEYDLTSALERGEVRPKGIDLNIMNYHSADRHWRMGRHQDFDICEYSSGSYLASRAYADEYPFTAIPVFPHRRFRHSYIFKSAKADIEDPSDFEGKDVAIKHWQNSAGLWMRGLCAEQYGLDLESVNWHFATAPGNVAEYEVPDRYNVQHIPEDRDFEEMLKTGELDAALHPAMLESMKTEGSGVERVFENSMEVEIEYFQETGVFPIMHVVVIRDDVLEEHPWVAQNMYEAFEEARDVAMNKIEDPRWTALAWARQHLEHQQEILGMNPYPYGIEDNELALQTWLRYAHDQGLIPYEYDYEELFVPSTLDNDQLKELEQQGATIQSQPDQGE